MARAPCIEEHKENGVSKEEQEKKDSKFFFLTETKPRLERKRTPRIAKTASIFFFLQRGWVHSVAAAMPRLQFIRAMRLSDSQTKIKRTTSRAHVNSYTG